MVNDAAINKMLSIRTINSSLARNIMHKSADCQMISSMFPAMEKEPFVMRMSITIEEIKATAVGTKMFIRILKS